MGRIGRNIYVPSPVEKGPQSERNDMHARPIAARATPRGTSNLLMPIYSSSQLQLIIT